MNVGQLLEVIFTAGVVFDNLSTSRPATGRFLETGDTTGVRGRGDLALLEDLKAAGEFILSNTATPISASYLRRINATLTRSAALNPGSLRTNDQGIGVRTRYGRHEPPAVSEQALDMLITEALNSDTSKDAAVDLFLEIARAQPFEDGNKRTAIFAANSYLLGEGSSLLLTVPFDEDDPSVAEHFNDLLARFYVFGEKEPVRELLVGRAFVDRQR
ncbi:cell filamentation protein Fic [Corynebacterium sp. HMSC036E10]|uniref:Fic family protein n=1 Tax=Corynebacterium sp. HMSC036E10 TaxID=1715215 RepID=UPI0008A8F1C6|nr:Fic family protein [Corynebacterium sp. HMSC036E10]OHO83356.1 cell filamentation protein Fic [Corynebacterium sp. HMSC036E10]